MTFEYHTPSVTNLFEAVLLEGLKGKETPVRVTPIIAIAGTEGAGSTTTCHELARLLEERGHRTTFYSSVLEKNKFSGAPRGSQNDFLRDPDVDRSIDKSMAMHLINPNNAGSVVIAEGKLTPFVVRELEAASEKFGLKLPFEAVTVVLHADSDLRFSRKYNQDAKTIGLTLSPDEYRKVLDEQYQAELEGFRRAYPILRYTDPSSLNFNIGGKPVYDLAYETGDHESSEIAKRIYDSAEVQRILPLSYAA